MPVRIDELTDEAQTRIHAAILAGRKLEAVKIYWGESSASLMESKSVIEAEMERLFAVNRAGFQDDRETPESDEMDRILNCIFANQKIEAVKIYKDATGDSLMDAKKFIDELTEQLSRDCPGQFAGGQGYQTGCMSTLLFLLGSIFVFRICSGS